jgi:hypothetical protein
LGDAIAQVQTAVNMWLCRARYMCTDLPVPSGLMSKPTQATSKKRTTSDAVLLGG